MRNVLAPQQVEIDPACHAVYVRFKRAKIKKTVSDERPGAVVAVDLDAQGDVIGLEVVGIKEFSLRAIRRALPASMRNLDFERARFMPAASCSHEPVPAS